MIILAVLLAGGILLGVLGMNQIKSSLSRRMVAGPGSAVVAYTIDSTGEIVKDGTAVFLNPDEPLVLASTMKLVVLAAYAEAVAGGALDPTEHISLGDVERYFIPNTDGGAHVRGLRRLGIETDADGFSVAPSRTVSLEDIARIMVHESGNAETDYLISRLGVDRLDSVMRQIGMHDHEPLRPIAGIPLAIMNHETPDLTTADVERLIAQVVGGDTAILDDLVDRYINDSAWRTAQVAHMRQITGHTRGDLDTWEYHAAATGLFPRGTAREYASLMAGIASGTLLSPPACDVMQDLVETIPADRPLRWLYFDRFGSKGGSTAGVQTLAAYGVPRSGALRGQTRVVVVFVNGLSQLDWVKVTQFESIYLLAVDLARATGVHDDYVDHWLQLYNYDMDGGSRGLAYNG